MVPAKAIIDLPHRCPTCHSQERSLVRVLSKLPRSNGTVLQLTDRPVDPAVSHYFVELAAPCASAAEVDHILERFKQVQVKPKGTQSFAEAALEDPEALDTLRRFALTVKPGLSRIDPWKPDEAQALAQRLDVRFTQNVPPSAQALGQKSGSRALFATLTDRGVRLPPGSELLFGSGAVADYIFAATRTGDQRQFIIKLDKGQAGEGNAVVNLGADATPPTREQVGQAVDNARTLGHAPLSAEAYRRRMANPEEGAVVEAFLPGPLREASGKVRLSADGTFIIGVHMQRMGQGPTNSQSFVGGVTPADPDCAPQITRQLRVIGDAVRLYLANAGVKDPHLEFGVDFLVAGKGQSEVYASEINLRHTGMSPTDWLLQYVVGARFDETSGALYLEGTQEPRFVQTRDWVQHPTFLTLPPATLIGLLKSRGLHFDANTKSGVIVQAFEQSANSRVPVVCVGRTAEESEKLLFATLDVLAQWAGEQTGTAVSAASLLA